MAKKVLVVDDEKLIVKGIRFSLEQDGMEVDCASFAGFAHITTMTSSSCRIMTIPLAASKSATSFFIF